MRGGIGEVHDVTGGNDITDSDAQLLPYKTACNIIAIESIMKLTSDYARLPEEQR